MNRSVALNRRPWTPLQAWVVARMICGLEVEKEHLTRARDSSAMGVVLEGLGCVAVKDRAKRWHTMTTSPELEGLAALVDVAEPLGLPPGGDAAAAVRREWSPPAEPAGAGEEAEEETEEEGWGPLLLGGLPRAEPFPCGVFPRELEAYCRTTAQAIGAPVDYVGLAMLATAGSAVGQSVNIELKRGWAEAPLLYAIVVGDPGKAKTPALAAVVAPLTALDERLRDESRLARECWRDDQEDRVVSGERPPRTPEPPRLRAIVKDITRESLCLVLADNPRGVLCAPDEATAWVDSWNQYKAKGGTDEQFWLSLYSGGGVSVDRKGGRESLYVPHPFCALLGSIQPDLLPDLKDDRGRDNGFLDRLVFAYPDGQVDGRWTEVEVSEDCEGAWTRAVSRLHGAPAGTDEAGRPAPWTARFTPEAKARYVAWYNENAEAASRPDAENLGALSKAKGRLARLALILSRLRLAVDPLSVLVDPAGFGVPPVELRDVEGAILLDPYLGSHLERVLHTMNRGGLHDPDARALLEWLRRGRRLEFRESDARWDLYRFRFDPDALTRAVRSLSTLGLIRPIPHDDLARKKGRKPTPCYKVHPGLHASAAATTAA